MFYIIYTITNKVNGHQYVGYTSNPQTRWNRHKRECNKYDPSAQHKKLYAAMVKYGIDNFDFQPIYMSKDKDYTKQYMEGYFIRELSTHMSVGGYNMTWGGDGGPGVTSDVATRNNKRRMENGTHVFQTVEFQQRLSEWASQHNAARIATGSHIMQTDEFRAKATEAARKSAAAGKLFRQSPEGKARSKREMQAKMSRPIYLEAKRLCAERNIKIKSLHIRKDEWLQQLVDSINAGTYQA